MEEQGVAKAACEEEARPSVWRYVMANRAHLCIDAADYFAIMRRAMLRARQRIFLIGWDFDSRIMLPAGRRWWQKGRKYRFPARLGSYILWLVKKHPQIEVRLLKWNFALVKYVFRGTMLFDLVRWVMRKSRSISSLIRHTRLVAAIIRRSWFWMTSWLHAAAST